MAAHGQPLGLTPEVSASVPPSSHIHAMDVAVSQTCMEHHHSLRPFQQRFGDFSSRDCVVAHDNSPRFSYQNPVQLAHQAHGSIGNADPIGSYRYEDFAGILGDRLASGSLSEASASDKVCSGHSSLGENHGPRVKLMFSFGGKIIPRPGDGKLRYVGGDTRIISVYRFIKYGDLMQKMARLYEQPVFLKYQLPTEDLDSLISISCEEDVENMIEEFDRLQTLEGSNRLRIFVFSPADCEAVHATSPVDISSTDQIYMDAVNGMGDLRAVNMVPLRQSTNLTGKQAAGTVSAPRMPCSFSYIVPTISNTQLAPSLVQPVAVQCRENPVSGVLSMSPSSVPVSPTVASQVSLPRQPVVPDVTFLYGDTFLKSPVLHVHQLQGLDGVQGLEGFAMGISSVDCKYCPPYRNFEEMRLSDLAPKFQHEITPHLTHYRNRTLEADSVSSQTGLTTPTKISAQNDFYGKFPRVGSDRNLLAAQGQKPELIAPIVSENVVEHSLSDPLQPTLDIQSPILHPNLLSHCSRHYNTETRREDSQSVDSVRLAVSDSLPHQGHARMLNLGQKAANYKQQIQSTGALNCIAFQKPLTVQTRVRAPSGGLHPDTGQATAPIFYLGSAAFSPRAKFQGMDINLAGTCPDLVGCGDLGTGGLAERPVFPISGQPQVEPVLRGLKPLNVHVNRQEQLDFGDEQFRMQKLPAPLSKQQEILDGLKQQEWNYADSFFSESLIEPRTTPYPGGSPYKEHLTPFTDCRLSRKDEEEREHMNCDNVLVAYPNNLEGVDWTMRRPEVEKATTRLSGMKQVNLRGEATSGFGNYNITGNGPGFSTENPSVFNPLPTSAASSDVFKTSFTPSAVVGPPQILSKGRESTYSVVVPVINEASYPDPDLLAAVPETFVLKAAHSPAPCLSPGNTNPNSFFVSNLEEGKWTKGVQDATKVSEDFLKPEKRPDDGLCFPGKMGIQACEKDMQFQAEQGGHFNGQTKTLNNVVVANMGNKANEAANCHFQLPTSQIDHTHVDATNSLVTPLSPHGLACSSVFSPLDSHDVEPLANSCGSAEEMKECDCGNFASCILMDGQECLPSEHNQHASLQNASLVSSHRPLSDVEAKGDLPIFDAGSVEEHEIRCSTKNSKASANAEATLLPPTLYSAPTLSMQNWEDNFSFVKLEDSAMGKTSLSKDILDNSKSLVSQKVDLEVKVATVSNDLVGTNSHLNPAAKAEAEAVSRGLQTIKNADLEELCELGTGTFGTVYHGKWRGTDVAIKRIKSSCFSGRPSERDRLVADFWREAYILGQLHHPNVVAFYGVVPDGPGETLATVTEYMVNGSLKQVLQRKDRTIDRRKRLLIIMDAAFGMEYLHGRSIVHFDLKCENLLVNMKDPQRPICKVGDLGLSKVKHQTMVSGGVRGTLPWMAPELLNGNSNLVSEKVDVFSFGIVMWELLTSEEPYANMHYGAIIGGIANNTLRPPVPSWCDPAWKSLMEKCWSADPGRRPTFSEIAAELRAMANS